MTRVHESYGNAHDPSHARHGYSDLRTYCRSVNLMLSILQKYAAFIRKGGNEIARVPKDE
jgi:hypothetical protein